MVHVGLPSDGDLNKLNSHRNEKDYDPSIKEWYFIAEENFKILIGDTNTT